MMQGKGMAAGYSQGLCFIPGAKVGPVPVLVIDTILENICMLCSIGWGGEERGGGGVYRTHIIFASNVNTYLTVIP
jgi:hypothetical protein